MGGEKMEPKQGETIIAGVLFKRKFHWYCTERALWKMDYRRLYDSYHDRYRREGKGEAAFVKEVGSFGEFISSRYRIPVLDKDTAKEFLKQIAADEISAGELAYMADRAEVQGAIQPELYVNFDGRQLYAADTAERFEQYAPAGWKTARADFRSLIPEQERFWR